MAAAAATVALSGTAQAALVILGNGTVRDTNTNLIWLQNWNFNGQANWGAQKTWAETTLDGFAGSNDWRLPEISEYGALFTAYGNLTPLAEFTNVQPRFYWSGTEVAPGISAWFFRPESGNQGGGSLSNQFFAVAVRPGGVAASVPEPQTLALALLALGAMVVARRSRTA
jgi:hypothetical protein